MLPLLRLASPARLLCQFRTTGIRRPQSHRMNHIRNGFRCLSKKTQKHNSKNDSANPNRNEKSCMLYSQSNRNVLCYSSLSARRKGIKRMGWVCYSHRWQVKPPPFDQIPVRISLFVVGEVLETLTAYSVWKVDSDLSLDDNVEARSRIRHAANVRIEIGTVSHYNWVKCGNYDYSGQCRLCRMLVPPSNSGPANPVLRGSCLYDHR
jgi:hypothetical protein